MLFINEVNSSRASLVYWKIKQIQKVAHSLKDRKTLNVSKLVDDAVYFQVSFSQMTVKELKDKCLEGEVLSYPWFPTKEMMAESLTKEIKRPSSMEAVIKDKGLILNEPFRNEVKNFNGELRGKNIHNHKR